MVEWTAEAEAELEEIFRYLYSVNPKVALSTNEAILEKIGLIASYPLFGVRIEGLDEIYRRDIVSKTQYLIYYKVLGPGSIKVLVIIHGKRKKPTLKKLRRRAR
jgi:plasmid stabilization system protein ParE